MPGQGGKFTNYSPIKEADNEYNPEESKGSSTAKKDITQSYGTETDSKSMSYGKKKFSSSGKKNQYDSSGGIDESSNS